jgi:hypothetical protein
MYRVLNLERFGLSQGRSNDGIDRSRGVHQRGGTFWRAMVTLPVREVSDTASIDAYGLGGSDAVSAGVFCSAFALGGMFVRGWALPGLCRPSGRSRRPLVYLWGIWERRGLRRWDAAG